MKTFFDPRSVAVVGVSESPTNLGRRIMNNMIQFDYSGIVYAVGPKGGVIHGRRIYHSVLDIPDQVDLAVILTPARTIPRIIDDCGQKGISHAVIESAGFREYGEAGVALEKEVLAVAGKWSMRLLGPNGIGTMNMENGLATPFATLSTGLAAGGISIISQSGGVGLSYMNLLASESLGLNKFASIGNKLDVDENDVLEYLIGDEGTKIICMYLEGISDGRRLMEIAARSEKPILLHKSNIGEMGNRIAHSHTAALSSDDKVVDAALRQCGIIRFHDMHKLGDFLKILELPPMRGKNLAILSRSGGHAVIAADACEMAGFDLPQFPPDFLAAIEKHFRANVIKLMNPLDLGDLFDPDVYIRIMEETIQRDEIDGIVFLHTYNPQNEMDKSRKLLPLIEQISERYAKPIAVCISSEEGEISLLRRNFAYPIFTNPEEPIRALDLSREFGSRVRSGEPPVPELDVDREAALPLIERAREEGRSPLMDEALEILEAYGLPVKPGRLAVDAGEARRIAGELGYPVTMKVSSPQISHKSDVGGVQLDIRDDAEAEAAFRGMVDRVRDQDLADGLRGVVIQSMARRGRDLILGARQNAQFGPIVMVGIGGIFVEIFKDVSIRVLPVGEAEAMEMFHELKGSSILHAVRGIKGSDLKAGVEAVLRLGRLISDFPEIEEIDINPMRLFFEGEGGVALDARIVLGGSLS